MYIMLLILVVAGLMIFSVTTRNHITTTFTTAGYLVQGVWARRPTTGQVLRILAIPIALMFVPWIIFFFIMWWLGTQFNAPQAGMWIGILLPIWSLLFIIRKIHPFRILYRVFATVLLIAILLLLIGFWSPDVKNSLNERSDDSKVWTANFFKKGSAHSERNAGVRARTKSATGVYDDFRRQIKGKIVSNGTIVMADLQKSKPATEDSEALMLVMLPNEYKNYVGGEKVWIPTLKLEFINNEEQENSVSVSKNIPSESWKLCWNKPEGYAGVSDLRGLCGITEIKKDKDKLFATFHAENPTIFKGVSIDGGKTYQGMWKDRFYEGEFFLEFFSENSAMGYSTDKGTSVRIDLLATKI